MGKLLLLIIQLASGAVGGNVAGSFMEKFSLGTRMNSIVGLIGGAMGGQLLGLFGTHATGGVSLLSVVASILGGVVGGGALLAIVGFVRKAMGIE